MPLTVVSLQLVPLVVSSLGGLEDDFQVARHNRSLSSSSPRVTGVAMLDAAYSKKNPDAVPKETDHLAFYEWLRGKLEGGT